MMNKSIPVFTFIFCSLASGVSALAETLHLARNEKLVEQSIAATLLRDISERSHLTLKITPLPPTRANRSALNNEVDGEVARIDAYALKNPTLTKVSPAYYYLSTVAFAKTPIVIQSKEDLSKYRVGAIRGVAHSIAVTEGLKNVEFANDARSLFLMLQAGRFDIAIDTGRNGSYLINKMALSEIQAVGELARQELFAILSPTKKHLAPQLSSTISKLKASGELANLTKKYEQEFLQSGAEP
jgi:ABC-type amino acid transport substrate-binding protein